MAGLSAWRYLAMVGMLPWLLLPVNGAAQSPFGSQSSDVYSSSDMSSNAAVTAAMSSPLTGEPYAARKVSRSVWKLADGTTITHESETEIARDAQGRVREAVDQTSSHSIGGKQIDRTVQMVTIADPVEHTLMILTPAPVKMAMRMQLPDLAGLRKQAPGGSAMGGILEDAPPPPPPFAHGSASLGGGLSANAAGLGPKLLLGEGYEVRTEELGSDAVDGLHVTGRRVTTTIPEGKIGNDRPIVITHEEWYSPDLKVIVKSEDNDPRSGERTMELQGLTLGDPDPALFKVPADYKVQDMADAMRALGSLGRTAAGNR